MSKMTESGKEGNVLKSEKESWKEREKEKDRYIMGKQWLQRAKEEKEEQESKKEKRKKEKKTYIQTNKRYQGLKIK